MSVIHLDEAVLGALQEVMEQEYPLLLDTFLSDSSARLKQLQRAADAEALSQAAHSLKGSSSNMGAVQLAELCRQLEQQAHQLSPAETAQLLQAITDEMVVVQRLYTEERQRFLS
ncbi:Hpt domain-containing protein [Pseudomonas sp. HR96]|uniref:Hpt domain-containing protein n=1 Tax=Pseudomonas sp. HR96 TaxID=1027966 RepID=UPI002A75C977|nr:Hpt domain-containing protein [Pseudomonas sp. HR96]WPP01319.1 Hpt domain-containing protein [Pseudomonas sp. HR96]